MPLVPAVALDGHVFELVGGGVGAARWGRCRKCLMDVPWWALVERRWVGVGFWNGMPRAVCMGAVRALGPGPVEGGTDGGGWPGAAARWAIGPGHGRVADL
jgi:hypothetical protein